MNIVLVEDDALVGPALHFALKDAGHAVSLCETPAAGLLGVGEGGVDIVVTDLRLAGYDGVAFIRNLRALHPEIAIVAISGGGSSIAIHEAARQAGADLFLQKPFSGRSLLAALERLIVARNG